MWTATISTAFSVLLLISASLVPYFVLRRNVCGFAFRFISSTLISLCNCFACGVFLATCFLGLIPHTKFNEDILLQMLFPQNSTAANSSAKSDVPLGKYLINTNLMVLVGILMMLLLEQLFAACYVRIEGGHSALSQGVSPVHAEEGATPLKDAFYSKRSAKTANTASSNFAHTENNHRAGTVPQRSHRNEKPHRSAKGDFEPLVNLDDLLEADESSDDDMAVTVEEEDDDFGSIEFRSCHESPKSKFNFDRHSHCPSSGTNGGGILQLIMLLLAMSTHSVFEGIALGAQQSTEDFLKVLLSIMLHEVLCCFSYGISLSSQNVSLRTAVFSTLLLACSIPFGMLVMALLGSLDGVPALVLKFMLEGFSAGIFIFVACVEMLVPEFGAGHAHNHGPADKNSAHRNSTSGVLKALVVCFGAFVAFMVGFSIRSM